MDHDLAVTDVCEGARAVRESASFAVPPNACDTHAHVISPDPKYVFVEDRSYTPRPAPEMAYMEMLADTGMARGVLVQISIYGTDNRYLLEVLGRHRTTLRGVVAVEPTVTDDQLIHMDALGVKGVRFNALFRGGPGLDSMGHIASRIAELGWHVEVLVDARDLPELAPRLGSLPTPLVIDHLGHLPAALGPQSAGFDAVLALLRGRDTWVKLSGIYRTDGEAPAYPSARSLAEAVLATAPDRVVYGSDWPHVAAPYGVPDTGHLRNLLAEWISDPALLRRVLVENPARLYGFGDASCEVQ